MLTSLFGFQEKTAEVEHLFETKPQIIPLETWENLFKELGYEIVPDDDNPMLWVLADSRKQNDNLNFSVDVNYEGEYSFELVMRLPLPHTPEKEKMVMAYYRKELPRLIRRYEKKIISGK